MKKVWKVLLGILGGLLAILGLGAKASGKKKEEVKKLDDAIKQKDKEVKQTEVIRCLIKGEEMKKILWSPCLKFLSFAFISFLFRY